MTKAARALLSNTIVEGMGAGAALGRETFPAKASLAQEPVPQKKE